MAVATATMGASIAAEAEGGSVGDLSARSAGGQGVHADESTSPWAEQTDWASQQTRELAAAVHGAAVSFCMACDNCCCFHLLLDSWELLRMLSVLLFKIQTEVDSNVYR